MVWHHWFNSSHILKSFMQLRYLAFWLSRYLVLVFISSFKGIFLRIQLRASRQTSVIYVDYLIGRLGSNIQQLLVAIALAGCFSG